MPELVRSVRHEPNGRRTDTVLHARGDGFLVRTGEEERVVPGDDLKSALAATPDLTRISARERIEITCADDGTHDLVVAALHDPDPLRPFDEAPWPDGGELPAWDEFPTDAILTRRWLTIDGDEYHLLALGDRTRAVAVDPDLGRVESGEVLVSVTWSVDSAVTSSFGHGTLSLVGGDVVVAQHAGDEPEATIHAVGSDGPAAQVACWLDEWLYAPAFVLNVVDLPGLTAEERRVLLGRRCHHAFALGLTDRDRTAVVGLLCTDGGGRRLADALADPGSPSGVAVYDRLRAVLDGREAMIEFLQDHV